MSERSSQDRSPKGSPPIPQELPNPPYRYQRDCGGESSVQSCAPRYGEHKDILRGSSLMANR